MCFESTTTRECKLVCCTHRSSIKVFATLFGMCKRAEDRPCRRPLLQVISTIWLPFGTKPSNQFNVLLSSVFLTQSAVAVPSRPCRCRQNNSSVRKTHVLVLSVVLDSPFCSAFEVYEGWFCSRARPTARLFIQAIQPKSLLVAQFGYVCLNIVCC